ncbi:leucyl aminopeptidase family protein [Kordiimonas aestuarii]|uniref:leucyl aminopeptidase family protein n=1 Tax=Kordiimonas aestuarii TaxID=1005925 RepID=UPI0021CF06F8|nr:leucyl aminopeptidase family protein [Kordiimonas aestuarii]
MSASDLLSIGEKANAIPLRLIGPDDLGALGEKERAWAKAMRFEADAGKFLIVPGDAGAAMMVLVGTGGVAVTPWTLSEAAAALTEGDYRLEGTPPEDAGLMSIGWCLAQYRFGRYRAHTDNQPRNLILPEGSCLDVATAFADASAMVRDLVNTPAEDMGPAHLQDAAEGLAEEFGGSCSTIVGDDLLDENFPAIHAVGRAAAEGREPRLIDLNWGNEGPKLTLVGKGVCFDTGGLDLKPASGMLLMKKDMGGAAHALAFARLVMSTGLKVQLRVLIPAVENAVDGNAYRPGDVVMTRKGLSVEIGNTDAEGRVVLCDALALAGEDTPDLLMDFATLTGAARVALGPDLPATYSNSDSLWAALEGEANLAQDPLWRMPLWAPYDAMLKSDIADLNNTADGPFGGSITAALYLQRFVEKTTPWVHFDVFAWCPSPKPGRPKGGDAQGLRACYGAVKKFLQLDD